MHQQDSREYRLAALLFAGSFFLLLQRPCSAGWQYLLPAVAIGFLLDLTVQRHGNPGLWDRKWFCIWQGIGLFLLLTTPKTEILSCGGANSPLYSVVLVLIAARAALGGVNRVGRMASVLLWLILGLGAILLVSGIGKIRLSNLRSVQGDLPWELVPVLLFPTFFSKERAAKRTAIYMIPVLLIPLWVSGILSTGIAGASSEPFITALKLCSLSSSVSRLESLGYLILLLSGACLYGGILGILFDLGERFRNGYGRIAVCLAAAGLITAELLNLHMDTGTAGVLITINWVFLPLILQDNGKGRNMKKREKNS